MLQQWSIIESEVVWCLRSIWQREGWSEPEATPLTFHAGAALRRGAAFGGQSAPRRPCIPRKFPICRIWRPHCARIEAVGKAGESSAKSCLS